MYNSYTGECMDMRVDAVIQGESRPARMVLRCLYCKMCGDFLKISTFDVFLSVQPRTPIRQNQIALSPHTMLK
jgi:hypothetical protein